MHVGTDEWHRYIIRASTFQKAAHMAADLDLWLHCWDYEEGDDPPTLTDTWNGKRRPRG